MSEIWIEQLRRQCLPTNVHVCDGTKDEHDNLLELLIHGGMLIKLNHELRPNSYLARSDPSDVARLEKCTYICTEKEDDAGPNNNWMEPNKMKTILADLFDGCMCDKTMYIIPFVMGPLGDENSIYGIQITDSPYVVLNMGIMTHMGRDVHDYIIQNNIDFVKCVHSVGNNGDGWTSTEGYKLSLRWYSNKTKYITHFPEENVVYSYGSGYGGNSILAKKCVALRIASNIGRKNSWHAEHMMLLGLSYKDSDPIYIAGAFPSACGKTNLALINSTDPNWKVTTLGDDIVWLRPGQDGKLYGMNPETGFFGVASNTSWDTNPNAMKTISKNTIFTNVALTPDGDVWWEGLTEQAPKGLIDWTGKPHTGSSFAAHPNSRFTVSVSECPILHSSETMRSARRCFDDETIQQSGLGPSWVPISAILFGGKRKDVIPLVREALDWKHGIYMGATVCSEQTAAAEGPQGTLRYDPFAMLPFCGYNMGEYFNHWLKLESKLKYHPRFYYVNWFRKDQDNNFLWPGFSSNIKVLAWIHHRCMGNKSGAILSSIGIYPRCITDLYGYVAQHGLFTVDPDQWMNQLINDYEYLTTFGSSVPQILFDENVRMRQSFV